MSALTRPITMLIAALGGEGGGVLTNWIIAAAARQGFPAQSTSIPGVAQRTGATTYYIEIVPIAWSELGGKRPVLALVPGIGDIDVVVASELMEAGRAIGNGFSTPDRTLVIASTSRLYTIDEKIAMGDGRYDRERLYKAIGDHAQHKLLYDFEALAKQSGAMINAVMLGVIAGSGRLPIPPDAFEAAIRNDGKSVDNNLRGFRAGLEAARTTVQEWMPATSKRFAASAAALKALEQQIAASTPAPARDIMVQGARRLAAYQSVNYARLYLDRLKAVADADARGGAEGMLLREAARHLAVRMSFEDVIRVAQAKIDPARFQRIRDELAIGPGDPYAVIDFLKPGIEEFCAVLPSFLARPILKLSARFGWLDRVYWGMELKTTSINGYLRFWLLATLRRWRPFTYRYREEQTAIEAWLTLIVAAAKLSPQLGLEIAECARLIKGYGDTHKRGMSSYTAIVSRVIEPALAGSMPVPQAIDAIASARTAALVDPEGESLARCLADLHRHSTFGIAAE